MSLDFNRLCLRCMSPAVSQGYCLNCGAPVGFAQEPAFALTPGSILDGRYLVGGVLGHGGFGITYLGLDLKHETRVAIKEFMPADAAGRAPGQLKVTARKGEDFQYGLSRFFDEARTIYRYRNHANIVHIYKLFRENGTAYYVMEYLQGCDLRRYLKIRGGRLGFQELMTIVLPVMDALEYVHGDHVIHRDVSPDNIYLGDTVKLIDFGAARTAFAGQSKSFSIILKRGFAPEEQYRSHGRQGPWTDIYALAGTMYMALSGTMVPEAPERLVSDRLEDIRTLVPELPVQAGSALMTALAVRAESRYQRVADFRGALLGKSEKTQWGDDPQSAFRIYGIGGFYAGASLTSRETLWVGRDPQTCQLVYPQTARGVSRRHLKLYLDGARNQMILEDLHSSFGTWVNGQRIPGGVPVSLKSGDRFSFGEQEIFEVDVLGW